MTISAKITSKGQITLPAELRKALGLKPGDRVNFVLMPDGNYQLVAKTLTFQDLKGILKVDGPVPSIEQILADIEAAKDEVARETAELLDDLQKQKAEL